MIHAGLWVILFAIKKIKGAKKELQKKNKKHGAHAYVLKLVYYMMHMGKF